MRQDRIVNVPLQGIRKNSLIFDPQGAARPVGLALPWAMKTPAFQAGVDGFSTYSCEATYARLHWRDPPTGGPE